MNVEKWLKQNGKSLKGKTVVITGATGGLGKEICLLLARFEATTYLACRNQEKTEKLIEEIKTIYPNFQAKFIALDLNKFESVKSCIENLKTLGGIDVFIHNAGIYNVPLKVMDSGHNNVFQTNFLYPYYMTKELMSEFEKKEGSRVVVLGSVAHRNSKINEDDIDFSRHKKSSYIYGNSKRFLMFSLYELFAKQNSVKLSIVHPGVTLTNMTNHYPKAINWLVKIGVKVLFPKPKQAVLSVFQGFFDSCKKFEWIGPSTFDVWGKPKKSVLKSCSKEESKKIFDLAEKMYDKLKKKV